MKSNILAIPLLTVAITTTKNEDFLDSITIKDLDLNLIDLSGIDLRCQVRLSPGHPVVWLDLSTAGATLINGGASGTISFKVRKDALRFVDPGSYVLDMIASADGATKRVVDGTITIVQGVTV